MNNSKPLTYESLRTVLHHTDANVRFRLASQIPSIRTVEKLVPLKIQSLKYSLGGPLSINGLKYSISLYQKSKTGETPANVLEQNKSAFHTCDIDQYGFVDVDGLKVELPGDVAFQENIAIRRNTARTAEENEWEIRRLEGEIEEDKARLAKIQALGPWIDSVEQFTEVETLSNQQLYHEYHDIFLAGADNFDDITPEKLKEPEVEAARNDAWLFFTMNIEENQEKLQPLLHQRGDSPYPYINYIQLAIFRWNDEVVKHELVEYTAKLSQVEKYLCNFLFGDRKNIVYIKRLGVHYYKIMRMPIGLKIKIRNLAIIGDMVPIYENLKSIVDESSYPLEVIGTSGLQRTQEEFMHPVIRDAKKLIIRSSSNLVQGTYLSLYKMLKNPEVHRKYEEESLPIEDYIQLINHWLQNGRETGTCFTVVIKEEEIIIALLKLAADHFFGAIAEEKCVTIPMNHYSQIELSYDREVLRQEYLPHVNATPGWVLKIAVAPIV